MSNSLWDESDSDDDLPAEWEQNIQGNFIIYVNRVTGISQRHHPVSGHIKQIPNNIPDGWSVSYDESGIPVYTNSNIGCKTYTDPRFVSALCVNKRPKHQRFKYDKFSSVHEILLNKDLRGRFIIVTGSGCGLGLTIARVLASHGAVVICACSKCPPEAYPVFVNKSTNHVSLRSDILLANEKSERTGQLIWIQYNTTKLSSVKQFVEVYQSLGWPLHVCIIVADLLAKPSRSILIDSFKKLQNYLSSFIPNVLKHYFNQIVKLLIHSLIIMLNVIGSKWFPNWIPPSSCECSLSYSVLNNLTNDGIEFSIQHNYLAPFLLIRLIVNNLFCFKQSNSSKNNSKLHTVIISSDAHKASPLLNYDQINFLNLFHTITNNLLDRLKLYANSKLCLLLFVYEFQQYLHNQYFSYQPCNITFCVCTGSDLFTSHCIGAYISRLKNLISDPLILLFHTIYLITRPFGLCLDQVCATPVLCAIDENLFNHKQVKQYRSTLFTNKICYMDKCQPGDCILNNLNQAKVYKLARSLWIATEQQIFELDNLINLKL